MTVAVVNSGVANLASVMAALQRLNVPAQVTDSADTIRAASHVILPGVGAASAAMKLLESKKLSDVIRSLKQPTLGICLGMQLMFERSEESGGCDCLGVIPGTIKKLRALPDAPVPHMGWNQLIATEAEHPLLRGIINGTFTYFVHSFAAPVGMYTIAACDYSERFTAIAAQNNFVGCQFHPERSSDVGRQILLNFLDM